MAGGASRSESFRSNHGELQIGIWEANTRAELCTVPLRFAYIFTRMAHSVGCAYSNCVL